MIGIVHRNTVLHRTCKGFAHFVCGNTTVEASLLRSNEREHFCFSSLSLPSSTLTDVNALLNFPHITDLDLSNNDLEELPLLFSFKFLKTLNLCNNRLEHLPPISNCTELIKLDLSGNILTDMSTTGVLPELRELYLQCNCISTVDGKLAGTTAYASSEPRNAFTINTHLITS
ncbi:unnamed protein product [Dibothriocephalus latus]|uniref:Uncharacterized protein n=1 Tax=Dibothriocephalus latus TaxID=60516 RepID=A0A3P6QNZ9_DIBLA|nr:unnamed protein product [Dibothriocephalus latus]